MMGVSVGKASVRRTGAGQRQDELQHGGPGTIRASHNPPSRCTNLRIRLNASPMPV